MIHDAPSTETLARTVRDAVIGKDAALPGPYGTRRLVYADYTASGRAVSFNEDYLRSEVLPFYGNTHTEASSTGRQTTQLREEARRIVHRAVGGGDDDIVVFTGSGSTAAMDKLVAVLNLRVPRDLDRRYGLSERIPERDRPVVFIGPYEHHSNELAFRESIATVVRVGAGKDGRPDLPALERALLDHAARPFKIGSFSAASNVTGTRADVDATTALLHRHGALAFWDYAAAGAHVRIDMNPGGDPAFAKDAVFLSPHKLVGGPGSPGVLVAKRRLFGNRVPSVPGGGTISYVNADVHHYIADIAAREEGGTPAIVDSIRAALAFQLKQAVGERTVLALEGSFTRRAIARLSSNPNIALLGDLSAPRLPIVSFLVRHPRGYLHHNFVVTLLSDLFGVQARGGCACAGPYGHDLLGVDAETAAGFEREVLAGRLGIKPGFARIGFSYAMSEAEFEHVLGAVDWTARHAHLFLADYAFDAATGDWSHRRAPRAAVRLGSVRFAGGGVDYPAWNATIPESALDAQFGEAENLLRFAASARVEMPALPSSFEDLRWFPLPGESEVRFRAARRERLNPRLAYLSRPDVRVSLRP